MIACAGTFAAQGRATATASDCPFCGYSLSNHPSAFYAIAPDASGEEKTKREWYHLDFGWLLRPLRVKVSYRCFIRPRVQRRKPKCRDPPHGPNPHIESRSTPLPRKSERLRQRERGRCCGNRSASLARRRYWGGSCRNQADYPGRRARRSSIHQARQYPVSDFSERSFGN